ncbi:uncharacterized protein LOC124277837 [Haliotis rubra]|uniref:uncharacterized protein LOC124277837 n=1 Tax=Haliotis rubra TaxID=36100 RepID=UPI001EE54C1C|nr:uncharacterized protein LOC124277837 [Haliotis rubra]
MGRVKLYIYSEKTSDDEPRFLGTESISKLLCHCARESTSPRYQKKAVRNFVKMNSISKSFQEESKPKKDTPAVKGILTLFFCIVYAAVLFIMAAVLSRVASSFGKSAASTPGVQIQMWETDTKKHMDVRQNRLAHTRWGQ